MSSVTPSKIFQIHQMGEKTTKIVNNSGYDVFVYASYLTPKGKKKQKLINVIENETFQISEDYFNISRLTFSFVPKK